MVEFADIYPLFSTFLNSKSSWESTANQLAQLLTFYIFVLITSYWQSWLVVASQLETEKLFSF